MVSGSLHCRLTELFEIRTDPRFWTLPGTKRLCMSAIKVLNIMISATARLDVWKFQLFPPVLNHSFCSLAFFQVLASKTDSKGILLTLHFTPKFSWLNSRIWSKVNHSFHQSRSIVAMEHLFQESFSPTWRPPSPLAALNYLKNALMTANDKRTVLVFLNALHILSSWQLD